MIVFIHGTIFPVPFCTDFEELRQSFFDQKKNIFQAYMDASRMKGIYQYQPIGQRGLQPIMSGNSCSVGCQWAVKTCKHVFGLVDDYAHAPVSFYTFGWSGALKQSSRLHYGRQLYQELSKEVEVVLAQKKITRDNLEVIIMAHSHGGNVALNMATCCDTALRALVDQLVLLGTPIQKETQGFVKSPLFKSIYSFYSEGDKIQTLDFVSTEGTSKRRFSGVLDKKLTQVEVTIGKEKPTHCELWFFKGYNNILYRSSLDIHPLPFSAFIPFVLQKKVMASLGDHANDLLLNLARNDEVFEITLKKRVLSFPLKITKISYIPQSYLHVPELMRECCAC